MKSETALERRSSGSDPDVASRLKQAVRGAGGNQAVANRAGLKIGSLNNYLRQVRRLPAGAAAQIAAACNVSIDWLMNGEGPMDYPPIGPAAAGDIEVVQGPIIEQITDGEDVITEPRKLFATLNIDRMAEAIGIGEEAFAKGKIEPDTHRKAQVFALIYEFLGTHPPDKVRALIDLGPLGPDAT